MSLASLLANRFKTVFAAKSISIIFGGVLIIILARLLNASEYGLLFLTISVFNVVGLLSKLGIAKSAARYIAEYKEKDPNQIPHILRFSIIFNLVIIIIVCFLFFIFMDYIIDILGEPDIGPLFLVGILYIPFMSLFTYSRIILQGYELIKASSALLAAISISQAVFVIGLVFIGYGALGAFIGYIISAALLSAIGLLYVYIEMYEGERPGQIEPDLRRRITEYTIPLTATRTANILDKHIDTILVGIFLSPLAVSFYTVSKQVVDFIEMPSAALGYTLAPTYQAQKAKGNPKIAAKMYEEALSYNLLLYIPAASGLILISKPLIGLVFGRQYLGAVPVLQVLSIYAIVYSVNIVTSEALDYLGQAKYRALAQGVTSSLNVILNIILIPIFGVLGAAIATVITYSLYTSANLYVIWSEFELRVRWLLRYLSMIIIVSIIMSVIVYTLIDNISSFMTLFAVIIIGVIVWGFLITITGLLDYRRIISVLS